MPHQKINKLSETGLTSLTYQTKMLVFMLMFEIETWLTCQATMAVLKNH